MYTRLIQLLAILLIFSGLTSCDDAESAEDLVPREERQIADVQINLTEGNAEDSDDQATETGDPDISAEAGANNDAAPGNDRTDREDSGDRMTSTVEESQGSTALAVTTKSEDAAPVDGPSSGTTTYEPQRFDALLKRHVSNGKVDYGAFARSSDFAAHVRSLKEADPSSMSTNEALAFWVNAYNALVILNVNQNPGLKKPTDVAGFFDKKKFDVAGRRLTLNDIENSVIRPTFNEPLIHFGLVCAARSCPPLVPQLYTASNVRSLLAKNATNYLANASQNSFDPSTGKLMVSKIFEWYIVDFGGTNEGIRAFVEKHAPSTMAASLKEANGVSVGFKEYDWTLNGK